MLYLSIIALILTFIVIYLNIDSEIRNKHSKSYVKKNMNSFLDKLFFRNFIKEIYKAEYVILIICYIISTVGIILGIFELIGFIDGTNKFYSIYAVVMFVIDLILFMAKIIFMPLIDKLKSDRSSMLVKLIILLTMAASSVALVVRIIYFLFQFEPS